MKTKFLLFGTTFLLSLIFLACSSDPLEKETPSENPKDSEEYENNEVNPDYVSIDWKKNKLIEAKVQEGQYVFSESTETQKIVPGSVLTINSDTINQIVIVQSVSRNDNKVTIQTRQGDLCDIFANTEFTLSTSKDAVRGSQKNIYYPEKVFYQDETGKWKELDWGLSRNETYVSGSLWEWGNDDFEGDTLFSNSIFNAVLKQSKFSINIDLNMTLSFGGRTLQEVKDEFMKQYRSKLLKVDASINGIFNTIQELEIKSEGEYHFDKKEIIKAKKWAKPRLKILFPSVLGVPVEVDLQADMYKQASLDLEGEVSASAGFEYTANAKLGFHWTQEEGIMPDVSSGNDLTLIPPTIKGKGTVNAKASIYPHIYLMVYGVLGPSFDFKPYVRSEVAGGFEEKLLSSSDDFCAWTYGNYAGLDANFGISAGFLGIQLANPTLKNDLNILDKCLYYTPYDIRLLSSTSKKVVPGIQNNVTFQVFDMDFLRDKEQLTIFPQIVKFEGNGILKDKYGIADKDGEVTAQWIPNTVADTLFAVLYDADGKVIKKAKFYGEAPKFNIESAVASCGTSGDFQVSLGRPERAIMFNYFISLENPESIQEGVEWGSALYKNGKRVSTSKVSLNPLTQKEFACSSLHCFVEDLTIFPDKYTAIADKASYSIGLYLIPAGNDTVFVTPVSIEAPVYDTKPRLTAGYIENINDGPWTDNTNIISFMICFSAEGLFWTEPYPEEFDFMTDLIYSPSCDLIIGESISSEYNINQRPRTIRLKVKDLCTGEDIYSNPLTIP